MFEPPACVRKPFLFLYLPLQDPRRRPRIKIGVGEGIWRLRPPEVGSVASSAAVAHSAFPRYSLGAASLQIPTATDLNWGRFQGRSFWCHPTNPAWLYRLYSHTALLLIYNHDNDIVFLPVSYPCLHKASFLLLYHPACHLQRRKKRLNYCKLFLFF